MNYPVAETESFRVTFAKLIPNKDLFTRQPNKSGSRCMYDRLAVVCAVRAVRDVHVIASSREGLVRLVAAQRAS